MARGWESKAVEEQMQGAQESREKGHKDKLSPKELEDLRRKEVLILAAARVRSQLESATDDRYREQLRGALASLETQIAEHSTDGSSSKQSQS
jgi:hypothetical protein